jgi:hypothetical protein
MLCLAAPNWVSAQERSILRLLPTEDRSVSLNDDVQGALSASDFTSRDGAYLEAWSIQGQPGQTVTIDVISDDFDPLLYVAGPGLPEALADDDSGGACNARIEVTFLETGAFHIVVSSTQVGMTGTFRLRTAENPGPPLGYGCGELDPAILSDLPTANRHLSLGNPVTGRLDAGSSTVLDDQPVEAWTLTGTAGEAVTITMSSTDFDSYLLAYGPGMDRVETDDDGAGELNAQLTVRFRASGTFIVGASALSSGSAGSYTLEMVRTPGPLDLAVQGTLDIPGSTSGVLSGDDAMLEDRRSQAWTFEGTAGRTVTIDLSSGDFDSYLTVLGPGITVPLEDDDSGGDLHSRIVLTLEESGTFRIVVSALGPGAGAFELSVR